MNKENAMKMTRVMILMLVVMPLAAVGQFRSTDLENPPPVSIPEGVSQEAAKEAVANALFGRDWTIVDEGDDYIVADLHIRSHWAQIRIDFDDRIHIAYQDSDNLNYEVKDDREIIHKNYLSWVDNVVNDTRTQLARAQRNSRDG